jgi:hypothetical protein
MSHVISLTTAIDMTTRYRQNRISVIDPNQPNTAILCICETFDKAEVMDMLSQSGCESLRIYYGMDDKLNVHAILVGADENGADMLPNTEPAGVILEDGQRCPPYCPPPSDLNDQ